MSQLLIHDYLSPLDLTKKVSGSQRETIVREAFKDLLKAWGRQHDLLQRVTTVSVQTVQITEAMKGVAR